MNLAVRRRWISFGGLGKPDSQALFFIRFQEEKTLLPRGFLSTDCLPYMHIYIGGKQSDACYVEAITIEGESRGKSETLFVGSRQNSPPF